MIYLTKTNQTAIDHVSEFIDSNWREEGVNRYQNIGYGDIKNPVAPFRLLFVSEQNYKCCYCCRHIVNNQTTELEHIIPRTRSQIDQFEPYYILSDILRTNVIPQSVFTTATAQLNKPPFPHHIAYQNIVASCNGRTFESSDNFTCCNRVRKDDFIPPFNLMEGSIEYLPDGTIVYMPEITNREYLDILNLNKGVLINVRRLWYLFAQSELTLDAIKNVDASDSDALTAHLVVNAVSTSPTIDDDMKLVELFTIESAWDTFKGYDYFWDYYRANNAAA
jgi:hypothetical protein